MSQEVVVLDPAAAGEECRIGVLAESGERDRWRDLAAYSCWRSRSSGEEVKSAMEGPLAE